MKPPSKKYKVPHLALRMVRERTLSLAFETCAAPHEAAAIATALIGSRPVEHLIAILIDGRGHVTGVTTLSQGGMHGAGVRAVDVLRAVLTAHAAAFVLAHNHPSNDPTPSKEDVQLTDAVRAAGAAVGLTLLDHIVVTRSGGFRTVLKGEV